MKKSNISLFIPHVGCPNKCSFCNQNEITGQDDIPNAEDVKRAIETSLKKSGSGINEVAFFGGSFTAIDRDYMVSLLQAVQPYIKTHDITGIRCSTRPDAIDNEILDILKQFSVTSIELGAQSMDDEVLKANRRGHTSEDVIKASELIKEYNIELGLQMMTDLYMSSPEKEVETAKKIVIIKPKTVRIYPTVILHGTELEKLYNDGKYKPMPVDDRVKVAAKLAVIFKENDIDVIRIGLHASQSVKENSVANTFHDAFGELVSSEIIFEKIISNYPNGNYDVIINEKSISKFLGQKRRNIDRLNSLGYEFNIIYDKNIEADDFELKPHNTN